MKAVKAEVSPTGVVQVQLEDGQLAEIVFDHNAMPHRGRTVTTIASGYVVEVVLPYAVHVLRKLE